jgi:hypothetical protein
VPAILNAASSLADQFRAEAPSKARTILLDLIKQIRLDQQRIRILIRKDALGARLGMVIPSGDAAGSDGSQDYERSLPLQLQRRGVELKLVLTSSHAPPPAHDRTLITTIAQGALLFDELKAGTVQTVRELAARHALDPGDVSRLLPLAFLAPDIVEAVLTGHQPSTLTALRLKRLGHLPASWDAQRRLLGFSPQS